MAEEYQETIRNMKEKTMELESQLKYEREQSQNYYNVVDTYVLNKKSQLNSYKALRMKMKD